MNRETLLQQIEILLETTLEQFNQINAEKGRIPQIEIDLVLSNLRQSYEYVSMLDYVNRKSNLENPVSQQVVVEKIADKSEVEVPPTDLITETSSDVQEDIVAEISTENKDELSEIKAELKKQDEQLISDIVDANRELKELTEENSSKPEMTREMVKEFINMPPVSEPSIEKKIVDTEVNPLVQSTSLFDDILPPVTNVQKPASDEAPSLHEKISKEKSEDNSLIEKLQKKRIADLKAVIGINEKFLFINELFEGNLSLYNEGIEKLNSLGTFDEATLYIESELRFRYNWGNAPKADKMLMDLIERRFIS